VLTNAEVTAVLSGAESSAHVDEMLAGAGLKLPADELRQLDEAREIYLSAIESPT